MPGQSAGLFFGRVSMKFIKTFKGVPDGAIYPVEYAVGEDCPAELVAGATASGALGEGSEANGKTVPEIKAALDAAGIAYDGNAKKADLLALLPA